jgi:hypothetical protein
MKTYALIVLSLLGGAALAQGQPRALGRPAGPDTGPALSQQIGWGLSEQPALRRTRTLPGQDAVSLDITQLGDDNQMAFDMAGIQNSLVATQLGQSTLELRVQGGLNAIRTEQAAGSALSLELRGEANAAELQQTGAGNRLNLEALSDGSRYRMVQTGGDNLNLTGPDTAGKTLEVIQGEGNNTLRGNVGVSLIIEQRNGANAIVEYTPYVGGYKN